MRETTHAMPMYEYACLECGRRFEEMKRMSERQDAPPCPTCGSEATSLAISAPAVFGGTGFGGAPSNYGSSGNCFSGG